MNSKSTWIWITLAAILFVAVLGVERYGHKSPPGLQPLLPEFRAANVTSVQFAPAGQLEMRVVRTNGGWELIKPIVYPAQAASIEYLLQALERLAPALTIPAAEARQRDDKDFGFDPRVTLTLQSPEASRQLVIGSRTAPGDQLYVQVVGTEGVFVVDARLLLLLPSQPDDWRDTSLLDLGHLTFNHVTVSNATATLELQRDSTNALWRLTYPMPARANNRRLAESLQQLHASRVVDFVTDDPRGAVESFGFATPELELKFGQDTNLVAGLQFGHSPTNDSTLIYVRRMDFPTVVTVERRVMEPWLVPLEQFRDPHLVTLLQPVETIAVTGAESFVLQRTGTNTWGLADSDLPIDAGYVGELLLALVGSPIVSYKDSITEPDLSQYGLDVPSRRIVLGARGSANGTNRPLADLAFGAVKDGVAYVRRADENPVYGIDVMDYRRVSVAPWQLRDRKIWRFAVTNVVRVLVRNSVIEMDARRIDKNAWAAPKTQTPLNDGAVEECVRRFGELDALAWLGSGAEQRARFGFDQDPLQLSIELKDGRKFELEFGGRSADGYPYAAVQLGEETWFFECPLVPFELLDFSLLKPAREP